MTRGTSTQFTPWSRARRVAMLAAIPAAMLAVPAQAGAQATEVEIYGFVAPRCWVAKPALVPSIIDAFVSRGGAICNHATPLLRSKMRVLNADGTLMEYFQPAFDLIPGRSKTTGRAALEIVVSPQI